MIFVKGGMANVTIAKLGGGRRLCKYFKCFFVVLLYDIFHVDKTFYSPCPSLEGIKDALCKCS